MEPECLTDLMRLGVIVMDVFMSVCSLLFAHNHRQAGRSLFKNFAFLSLMDLFPFSLTCDMGPHGSEIFQKLFPPLFPYDFLAKLFFKIYVLRHFSQK